MPTSVDRLTRYLGISPARPVDGEAMGDAVKAANALAYRLRPDLGDPNDSATVWGDDIDQGVTVQAARLYGRRGSVLGVAAFQDVGASVIPGIDPDFAALLGLTKWQPSVVA